MLRETLTALSVVATLNVGAVFAQDALDTHAVDGVTQAYQSIGLSIDQLAGALLAETVAARRATSASTTGSGSRSTSRDVLRALSGIHEGVRGRGPSWVDGTMGRHVAFLDDGTPVWRSGRDHTRAGARAGRRACGCRW